MWVRVPLQSLKTSDIEFRASDIEFICFEQGVPWHSGNYRVWIHSETCTWHDENIQPLWLLFGTCKDFLSFLVFLSFSGTFFALLFLLLFLLLLENFYFLFLASRWLKGHNENRIIHLFCVILVVQFSQWYHI